MGETVTFFSRLFSCGDHSLELEFHKRRGQIEHRVSMSTDNEEHPLLQSFHECEDETQPPSPVFTELLDQNETLFLTGATTLAHWSMSIEMVDERIVFDVACRMKAQLSILESAYQILSSRYKETIEVVVEDADMRELGDRLVRIVPISQQPKEYPATVQWRYSIACTTN